MKYQRGEIANALNHICYCYFVYLYFLDGSTFACALRSIAQLQSVSPKALTHSIRLAVYAVIFTNVICTLRHIFVPVSYGILVDFVGSAHPPSKYHLILVDLTILLIQFILIFIAYNADAEAEEEADNEAETQRETPNTHQDSDHSDDEIDNNQERDPLNAPSEPDPHAAHSPEDHQDNLVVDVKFWKGIQRIARGDPEADSDEPADLESGYGLRLRNGFLV